MVKQIYPIRTLIIEREEGLDINGMEMGGTGTYNASTQSFEFQKTPKKQKAASKNVKLFSGNYMTMYLNKDGAHRVTIKLQSQLNISEVRETIINELRECLEKLQ